MFRRLTAAQTSIVSTRAFACTPVVRAGGFTAFIKYAYKNNQLSSQLAPLPITQRGRLLGKWWRAMSPAEQAPYVKAGAQMKFTRKATKKSKKASSGIKRKPSAYNKFVATNSKRADIQKLPVRERMGAIAKLWKASQ